MRPAAWTMMRTIIDRARYRRRRRAQPYYIEINARASGDDKTRDMFVHIYELLGPASSEHSGTMAIWRR